jgi:ribosomal protein L11 methyltransferase
LIRLAVRCSPDQADEVLLALLDLAPNGVEEERGPDFAEFAIYGAPGEVPDLGEIEAVTGAGGKVEVTTTEVPDDWADRWTDFHRPVVIADRLRVRPSWFEPTEGQIDVVVDPGMAFGTGAHSTTRLCLEMLVSLADAGGAEGPLSDWGTGSGVLAIAAAKLGWSPVHASDREPASLDAVAENASANGVAIDLIRADVRESPPEVSRTVVANLTAPLLEVCAGAIDKPPEVLVCSGMLHREVDSVSTAFTASGLKEVERRQEGEWSGLMMRLSS